MAKLYNSAFNSNERHMPEIPEKSFTFPKSSEMSGCGNVNQSTNSQGYYGQKTFTFGKYTEKWGNRSYS